jgi:hypothetical protein
VSLHLRIEATEGGHAVALYGSALGRVLTIVTLPTHTDAVRRAELEEKERGVPFVAEVPDGS